jgi:hypothetical protein
MNAMEKLRERLERAANALAGAGIPYAVVGGNAVAVHVARVDESLVRNTRDVDILVRRADFDRVKTALEAAGFLYRHVARLDVFLDGPDSKAGDGIHLVFAGEKAREDAIAPNPDVDESEPAANFRVLTLEALVRNKLTAYRDKDKTHLRDFIQAGLVDRSWPTRFDRALSDRLIRLLDDPHG